MMYLLRKRHIHRKGAKIAKRLISNKTALRSLHLCGELISSVMDSTLGCNHDQHAQTD
jgi:hypothetical protein